MVVAFDNLPDYARIWIYQCNRAFTDEELSEVNNLTQEFLEGWQVHGKNLKAAFELPYNRFLILAIDQDHQPASGCSIDASVAFIQSLEKRFDVDLLDKMNVTFKQGEYIAYKTLLDFKKMVKDKAVSPNTIVFNNLVTTKGEYCENWEIPAKNSWHQRFLK
ncbi:MAG: ABC transporter ATPase [Flavobacteriaceae bacterium]|nr:ABC transporter ATPase [Flavobacteriaceae bacterium]